MPLTVMPCVTCDNPTNSAALRWGRCPDCMPEVRWERMVRTAPLFRLQACPRCGGDLALDAKSPLPYEHCLQCGYDRYPGHDPGDYSKPRRAPNLKVHPLTEAERAIRALENHPGVVKYIREGWSPHRAAIKAGRDPKVGIRVKRALEMQEAGLLNEYAT